MARTHGKDCALYLDEFDFRGVTNGVRIGFEMPEAETTAFSDSYQTFLAGKPFFRVGVNGLWSAASPNYDGEMFTDLTSSQRRLGVYPGGPTEGNIGYEFRTNISAAPRLVDIKQAILLNVEWVGDQPAARGQLIRIATALGATGNGTGYEVGSVGAAQTAVGVLRLLAAPAGAGNNTLDLVIASAATQGGAYTSRLTFAQLSQASVATHEVVEAAGAITDTFWRVQATYAGAGTRTFSVVVALGIRST